MKSRLVNIRSYLKITSLNNFVHLLFNQGTNVLVALVVSPHLYQNLGEEKFGLVNLGLTVIMLFTILVNYGFHLNGPKRLALIKGDSETKSLLINDIIVTRLLLAVVLFVLILGLTIGLNLFQGYQQILIFSTIVLFNEAVFPMFIAQGLDRISLVSKANVLSKLVYLGLILLIIESPSDARFVNFFFGGASLLVNIILLARIYGSEDISFNFPKWGSVLYRLKENFQFFLSTIAGHISIHGGLVILSNFISDFELGQYSLAQRIAFLLRTIPIFVFQSTLQNSSRLYSQDTKAFKSYTRKISKLGLLLTFLLAVVVFLGAKWIILLVGGEFVPYSERVLQILAFIPFLSMLNIRNMIEIMAAEHKDVLAKATWYTALIMVTLSLIGSKLYGGQGLAVALLVTEVFNCLIHYWFLKKKRKE